MARTITAPRILHVSQGFTLPRCLTITHRPFDALGVEQGKRCLTQHQ
jgi:hypothetical protein